MIAGLERLVCLPVTIRGDSPLRPSLRRIGTAYGLAALISMFVNLAVLTVPLYDMQLYDRVLHSQSMDTLLVLSLFCVAGMVIYGFLEAIRGALFLLIGDRLGRDLGIPALKAALGRSLAGEPSAGAEALRDVSELRNFATSPAASIPLDLLWSPILVIVLLMLHPAYGVYALGCIAIMILTSLAVDLLTRAPLARASQRANAAAAEMAGAMRSRELIDGLGILSGLARRWQARQSALLSELDHATRKGLALGALARTLRLLMQGGIIGLGAVLVTRHEASPGTLMGATLIAARLLLPFEQLVSGFRQWVFAWSALARLSGVLNRERTMRDVVARDVAHARIELANVSFAAPCGRRILQGLSLTVEPGEAVAITGVSAAGKSTLARLLVGLFPPTSGSVCLGGHEVSNWERESFGRHVGYVPQTASLLDGTVFDNIARMRDASADDVVSAARLAGVHELIGRLPQGYGTWIGSEGYLLSGGQRQRIALARALFGNPSMVVMDEPNASLDHDGEVALADTVRSLKERGAVIVIITHRPAILGTCDRILTLQDGQLRITHALAKSPEDRAPARLRLVSH